jgi:hypothetical protein
LKLSKRVRRRGSEDPVDAAGVEAQLREEHLEFGHVVAAKRGTREVQETLAELPSCLFQSLPGREVDDTREWKSTRTLECFDERYRLRVKDVIGLVGRAQRESTQAFFEFANTRARGARAK